MEFRTEKDPLGEKQVPAAALYGIQTLRAVENFPISGLRPLPAFVDAVIWIKKAAALTHRDTGRLDARVADAIVRAADEVLAGQHRDQFVVDVYQAGAGTSHNMNCNEVLANRANELLGAARGSYAPVHPNDHVNMAQSTNDVIPTAMRLATLATLPALLDAMQGLAESFLGKGQEFDGIIKSGRTHLQDATPIRLGQEFMAWGRTVARHRAKLAEASEWLRPLNIGGTAVGTGLNAEADYPRLMVEHLRGITGLDLREAQDRIQLMQSMGDVATLSGAVRAWTLDLNKIANDLRLLASGPRAGLAELLLPANEPGSSIMPGKVNPTQAEALTMVCAHVMGNDVAVGIAGASGHLQLNVFKPMILHDVLESVELLADACESFGENCVVGIEPDREVITRHVASSLMLVTALSPLVGYANAAKIAKAAYERKVSLKEAAVALGLVTEAQFDQYV